jgi:YD repeat-containing protein
MLRFYARPGHVCAWPGPKFQGQPARYIGRTTKVTRDAAGNVTEIAHPAIAEPVEIDPKSKDGQRVLRLMRIEAEKPLQPADAETAAACGVPFVQVALRDGEWLPKPAGKPSTDKGTDK